MLTCAQRHAWSETGVKFKGGLKVEKSVYLRIRKTYYHACLPEIDFDLLLLSINEVC